MRSTVTQKLIETHLVTGTMKPGEEIGLRIDQTLTQDATGTWSCWNSRRWDWTVPNRIVGPIRRSQPDPGGLQESRRPLFLESACRRFGLWYSRPGNGVSHPVHQERFGKPGKTLLGSDSHTPAAGRMGMLAIGAGGLEVALAIAGLPFYSRCQVWGVKLTGRLPIGSRQGCHPGNAPPPRVDGGVGKIIEYYGPGLESCRRWIGT